MNNRLLRHMSSAVITILVAIVISYYFLVNLFIALIISLFVGIVCARWIFPLRIEYAFRQGVIPVFQALIDYSSLTSDYFIKQENYHELARKNFVIKNLLSAKNTIYPEWVYDIGFNPGLRAGLRFFLLQLEQIIEIFFSLEYILKQKTNIELTEEMTTCITEVTEKNNMLLQLLINYFRDNQLIEMSADFFTDIQKLTTIARRAVPAQLELLDISPDDVALMAFVRGMQDVRDLLLKLAMALSPLSAEQCNHPVNPA